MASFAQVPPHLPHGFMGIVPKLVEDYDLPQQCFNSLLAVFFNNSTLATMKMLVRWRDTWVQSQERAKI